MFIFNSFALNKPVSLTYNYKGIAIINLTSKIITLKDICNQIKIRYGGLLIICDLFQNTEDKSTSHTLGRHSLG